MAQKHISWTLPIQTKSELNLSQHWTARRKRHQQQYFFVKVSHFNENKQISLPCSIKLIRIGRKLDYDNLVGSFKWMRDCIADLLIPGLAAGRADDDPRISWIYEQEKGKPGTRIEIYWD